MSHELDPEGRQNIQHRRFLVIAARHGRLARKAVSLVAAFGIGLCPGEKLAAHHLRVRFEQAKTIAVPVSGNLILAQIWIGRFELDISRERLKGRSHQGIAQVVADPIEIAKTDQFTPTQLRAGAADCSVGGMFSRQLHRRPDLQGRTLDAFAAEHVLLIGAIVREEIELDELDALVFQIEHCAADSSAIAREVRANGVGAVRHAACVTHAPVIGPVYVRRSP